MEGVSREFGHIKHPVIRGWGGLTLVLVRFGRRLRQRLWLVLHGRCLILGSSGEGLVGRFIQRRRLFCPLRLLFLLWQVLPICGAAGHS